MMSGTASDLSPGLLGDTAERDYSFKLRSFNAFAEPELRQAIADMGLRPGMRVLDAGCGTGEALSWLWNHVQPGGEVVGLDLSVAHAAAARQGVGLESMRANRGITVIEADLRRIPASLGTFDLIWCANTLNHAHDPLGMLRSLMALLRSQGKIALGQSCLLPEMFFAWDARLERAINEAVHEYYRQRYGLNEHDLAAVRAIVGLLRQAGLRNVSARTSLIERLAPVDAATETYIAKAIFRDTWGARLQPFLHPDDYHRMRRLTDPGDSEFALRRPDFHFLQTFTVVSGQLAGADFP